MLWINGIKRALMITTTVLFAVVVGILPVLAQTQGDAIDPREMDAVNQEIGRLNRDLDSGSEEVTVCKSLLRAYDRRASLFTDGRDPEGEVQAEAIARRLLKNQPDDPFALFFSARAAFRENDISEARQLVMRAEQPQTPPELMARVQLLLGKVEFLYTNFNEAVTRASLASASADRALVMEAGKLLQTAKKFREERNKLDERLKLRNDDLDARIQLARLYLRPELTVRIEHTREILEALEKDLEKWPEYIPAQLFLARAVLEHTNEVKRAEKICRTALARTRSDVERKDAATLLNEILMQKITGSGGN